MDLHAEQNRLLAQEYREGLWEKKRKERQKEQQEQEKQLKHNRNN